jgi:DNA repair exonuclease SbcCD ATPase subunit
VIKWTDLHLADFLSWKELRLSLVPSKPTLILGDNRDNAGASSNGSGKSSIFDGLVWTLFGSTLRGLSGDEVIRHGEERALGRIFWSDEKASYCVERIRKPGSTEISFRINGKDVDGLTPTLTQKKIEMALGFEMDTFIAACIFGQDVTRWASYTDKDQKLILERLIGLSQWDRILKEVRDGRQAQGISKQLAEASLASATADLADLQDRQKIVDSEEKEWAKTIGIRSVEIEQEMKDVSSTTADISNQIKDKNSCVEVLKAESFGAAEALKAFQKGQIEAVKARSRLDRVEEKLRDLDESQADLDLHTLGDPCPTCERPFDEPSAAVANRGHSKKIESIEAERSTLQKEMEILQAVLKDPPPEEPKSQALNQLQEEMEKLSILQDRLHKQELLRGQLLAEIEQLGSKADAFDASRLEISKSRDKLQSKVAQMTVDVDEAQKNKQSYDWLEKAFGPQGIRNFLLESVLPRFEGWANDVLRELGPNLRLELRSQTALKSGELREKLNCGVFLDGRKAPYESLSAGERQRIDVSIALALEALSAERNPVGLAVFDEIFERMDPEGCERVARLLKKRFSSQGCWVITHNDTLKNLFREVLTVRKENGVSEVSK